MATVLITGAGGNLGKVVVDYFVARKHVVIALVSLGKAPTQHVHPNLFYYESDLLNETQTEAVIKSITEQHPVLDAAFLLAGGFAMGNIRNTDWQAMINMIDINFKTAYTVARPVFDQMSLQSQGGKIVFVGARPALNVSSGTEMMAYTLSKSLVISFAEMLGKQAIEKPISCRVIVPSTLDTPSNRASMPDADFSTWNKPEEIAALLENIAIGTDTRESVLVL